MSCFCPLSCLGLVHGRSGQAPGPKPVQILDRFPRRHLKNLDQLQGHPLKKVDRVLAAASGFGCGEGLMGDRVPGE